MKKAIMTGVVAAMMCFGLNAGAQSQDWYHDRDSRYNGDHWRSQVFAEVRTDLDHVWSEKHASDKERERLERHVNDVIDSLRKSSNDNRLSERDRAVLSDDVRRLKDLQNEHNGRH